MKNIMRSTHAVALTGYIAFASSPAWTQLEEVVITAQKKEQSLQDVPIAVTAFTGDELDALNIVNLGEIQRYTPGLTIAETNAVRNRIRIRGVGSRKFDPGADGAVGIFLDEVYMPRFSGADFALIDQERVEVIKGPQGTLYGRNTIGGAISVVSRKPTTTLSGNLELGLANEDSYRVRGSISGALTDQLSVRLSGGSEQLGGFGTNVSTGTNNDKDLRAFRLAALYAASDTLTISGSIQYNSLDTESDFQKPVAQLPGGFALPLLSAPTPGLPGTAVPVNPDPYSETQNFDGFIDSDSVLAVAKVEKELGTLNFVSVTGFRDGGFKLMEDFDRTQLDVGTATNDEQSETLSQEFRLSTQRGMIGAYFFWDEVDRTDVFTWNSGSLPYLLAGQPVIDSFPLELDVFSWALFGQYSFELTDNLSLNAGLRYTEDTKDFSVGADTSLAGVPIVPVSYRYDDKKSWDSIDGMLSIEYRIGSDTLTYLSYNQGFKSGGLQYSSGIEPVAREIYGPEQVDAFELGLKSEIFDGSARVNASFFLYDYTDMQQQRIELFGPTAIAVTRNAASSEIYGLDLDVTWMPTKDLFFRFAYNYLHAEFGEYSSEGRDFSGNPLPNAPEHTVVAMANYDLNLTSNWRLNAGLDFFWVDEQNWDVTTDDPFTQEDAYSIVSSRISLFSPDESLELQLWSDNMNEEFYRTSVNRRGPEVISTPGDARRFGIRAIYSF